MKMRPVLVAIAGDRDLRLLRAHAIGEAPSAVAEFGAEDFGDVAVEFRGRGRGQSGGGGGAHGYEAHHSEAEMERARFARHAAKAIVGALEQSSGGQSGGTPLLLVAGPKMLGELRDALAGLRIAPALELGKDLVKLSPHELAAHLDDALRQMATAG